MSYERLLAPCSQKGQLEPSLRTSPANPVLLCFLRFLPFQRRSLTWLLKHDRVGTGGPDTNIIFSRTTEQWVDMQVRIKALPLPCVSTACLSKAVPFDAGLHKTQIFATPWLL
eukprot:SAG22_NODE_12839_length_427_cov_1.396341_1_plen_112_part_10